VTKKTKDTCRFVVRQSNRFSGAEIKSISLVELHKDLANHSKTMSTKFLSPTLRDDLGRKKTELATRLREKPDEEDTVPKCFMRMGEIDRTSKEDGKYGDRVGTWPA
jgi:hypothetical protein